jgi:hypothetical protein
VVCWYPEAANGPTQCTGQPTARHGTDGLAQTLGSAVVLEHPARETHTTSVCTNQLLSWMVLRRVAHFRRTGRPRLWRVGNHLVPTRVTIPYWCSTEAVTHRRRACLGMLRLLHGSRCDSGRPPTRWVTSFLSSEDEGGIVTPEERRGVQPRPMSPVSRPHTASMIRLSWVTAIRWPG